MLHASLGSLDGHPVAAKSHSHPLPVYTTLTEAGHWESWAAIALHGRLQHLSLRRPDWAEQARGYQVLGGRVKTKEALFLNRSTTQGLNTQTQFPGSHGASKNTGLLPAWPASIGDCSYTGGGAGPWRPPSACLLAVSVPWGHQRLDRCGPSCPAPPYYQQAWPSPNC